MEKNYGIIFYITLCLVLIGLVGLYAYEIVEDLDTGKTFVLIIILSSMVFGKSVSTRIMSEKK